MIESGVEVQQGASVGYISHVPHGTTIESNKVLYGNPGVLMKKRGMETRDQVISLTGFDWALRIFISLVMRFL